MKVLVTGAAGFLGGYLVEELLAHGFEVVGVDNFSKYGELRQESASNPRYRFVHGDAKDVSLLKELLGDCRHLVAAAARIGGISYFHQFAYDLLAENERITAATFDAAIWAHRHASLAKITVISSSMVFENTQVFPTPEGEQRRCPPPASTYGFQKLATEYFAQGAHEQYGLPFTILRPFNCVGIGERRARGGMDVPSGNIKLALSHVVPDLVQKVIKGQDPLHILGDGRQVRHYTYGGDLARGIRLALEHPAAGNEDFNLSTPASTTILELAELIWRKVHGGPLTPSPPGGEGKGVKGPFRYVADPAFPYDVQCRIPSTEKARRLLGFEAATPLDVVLDEVIPWIRRQVELGTI